MAVLASDYVESELADMLSRMGFSNECTLVYTNFISDYQVFLERVMRSKKRELCLIVPKALLEGFKRPFHDKRVYIFISEKLNSNVILIC
ncbi:hypothetical protein WIW90_13750 [Sulfolobaceae archaeon RB850M]|jgi:hypothetical protein